MGDLGSISSWVDPLEEGMATHSIILTWRIPMDKALANYSPWGYKESDTTERLSLPSVQGGLASYISLVCANILQ